MKKRFVWVKDRSGREHLVNLSEVRMLEQFKEEGEVLPYFIVRFRNSTHWLNISEKEAQNFANETR